MNNVSRSGWCAIVLSFAFAAVVAVVPCIASWQAPDRSRIDPASALALITGTAVVIERALELGWTLVEQLVSSDWPKGLSRPVGAFVSILNARLTPYVAAATNEVAQLKAVNKLVGDEAAQVDSRLAAIESATGTFATSAPDNQRVQYIAKLVTDTTATLQKYGNAVDQAHQSVMSALDQVSTFLATFADNPGRRLISIALGSLLGLLVAESLGLDVFRAAAGSTQPAGWAGIMLTGLVIGLGSSPTHEVISALQEFKKKQTTA